LPELLIRQARVEDCPALGRILVAATQDAFQGFVPDRCLQWLTPEQSAINWARLFGSEQRLSAGKFLFVAGTSSQNVIGFALLGKRSEDDEHNPHSLKAFPWELRTLHVDPAWQRHGIGHRLVSRVADQVWQEGARSLLVRVLVENPNRGFYEYLGALPLGSQPYDWEGYQTEEMLYGWDAISRLRPTA
jgi:GNAT superfamily N-acetyltransferase